MDSYLPHSDITIDESETSLRRKDTLDLSAT